MPKLVVISEEMKDQTFELTGPKITIGRIPDNQIQLENETVSSHHAELIQKGKDYLVRDINSTNGTRVNGQRIAESRLSHGDTVSFGSVELQYLTDAKGAPQPLPQHKKTVDLSSVSATPRKPPSYGKTTIHAKKKENKSKFALQVSLIVLGVIVIVLLGIAVFQILRV